MRPALLVPGASKRLEKVDMLDSALIQLIEQTTGLFANDDSRAFRPPGEHLGIDALLVGHRNDQQPDPALLELIAERLDRKKRIGKFAFRSAGRALDHIAHARPIKEPAVTTWNGILAGIGKKPPLEVLYPRPEPLDDETRLLKALLVRVQVAGRRSLAENVKRAGARRLEARTPSERAPAP